MPYYLLTLFAVVALAALARLSISSDLGPHAPKGVR